MSSKLTGNIRDEKEPEYISKEEVQEGIHQGLKDVNETRKSVKRLKTLQEATDEP